MKICSTCVLPETFPGIHYDDEGRCQYCRSFKGLSHLDSQREKYRQKFEELIGSVTSPRAPYDILTAYSGGKDSTFILDILKNHYGLRVLALTFDHGFVSPHAFKNIANVTESLGIDHITFKASFPLLKNVFLYSVYSEFHPQRALERASSICNSCMGIVKLVMLNTAIEKRIPLMAYGWSPGQVPLNSAILPPNPALFLKSHQVFLKALEQAAGPGILAYFSAGVMAEQVEKYFPYNINLLAFWKYDETDIYERITRLGWSPPPDTDPNSTNCLLNAYANHVHFQKHGYHPYAMEMAEAVREGILSRDEALERIQSPERSPAVDRVMEKLGVAHV